MDTNKVEKGVIIRNGKEEVMANLAKKISMASLVEFVEAIANHCFFFFYKLFFIFYFLFLFFFIFFFL